MKRPLNSITPRSEDDKVNCILIQIHKAINAVTSQSGLSIDSSPSSPSNESLETLRQTSALLDDLDYERRGGDLEKTLRGIVQTLLLAALSVSTAENARAADCEIREHDSPGATVSPPPSTSTSILTAQNNTAHNKSNVCFNDVVGCTEAKQALHESVVLPLTLPDATRRQFYSGLRGSGSVLLHGPPGTGKTMLVKAAANEAGAKLVLIKPSDILSKFQGESENALKRFFTECTGANSTQPCVLFFDEFDSIACARSASGDGDNVQNRRLDSKHNHSNDGKASAPPRLVIVAATNRIEDIDEAAIRRFETRVHV
eukprot:GSChrysophyteH2.ASY1.ANO1.528.1 assembled CDS